MRPGGDVGRSGEEGGCRGAVIGGGEVVSAQRAARPVGQAAGVEFSCGKVGAAGASARHRARACVRDFSRGKVGSARARVKARNLLLSPAA